MPGQHFGYELKAGIAEAVAPGVVYALEVVSVDQGQGQWLGGSTGLGA